MKKNVFLEKLAEGLGKLPSYEISKTVDFYGEIIDDRTEDGMSEEEAVSSLGNVETIISDILIDTPLSTLIHERIKSGKEKAKHTGAWIALGICSIPLSVPLVAAAAVIILAVFIVIYAVAFSLVCVGISLGVASLGGIAGGVMHIIIGNALVGTAIIGVSVALAGVFMMTIKPCFALCKQVFALSVLFLRKIKSIFVSKKAVPA